MRTLNIDKLEAAKARVLQRVPNPISNKSSEELKALNPEYAREISASAKVAGKRLAQFLYSN